MGASEFPRIYRPAENLADVLPFPSFQMLGTVEAAFDYVGSLHPMPLDDDNAPMLAGERFPRLYDPEPAEGFEGGGGI